MRPTPANLLLVLVILAPLNSASAQWANVADSSSLPRGAGFADQYEADAGISRNANVICAEDFEREDYQKNWQDVRDDGSVLELDSAPTSGKLDQAVPVGKQSLQVTASLSKNTGGGLTTWFESSPTLFIRFYVRFDKDNAFTLESYVTDRWTKHETNRVWFDNVVIARDYIGPAGK